MQNEVLKKYTDLIKRIKLLRKSIIDVTAVTLTQIRDGKQLEPTILNRGWLEDLQKCERTLFEMESDGSGTSDKKDSELMIMDLGSAVEKFIDFISRLRDAQHTNERKYFAFPTGNIMFLILPLFAGHPGRIPKRLLQCELSEEEKSLELAKVFDKKVIEVNYQTGKETVVTQAIIAKSPKITAYGQSPELFEDIEKAETELAYYIRKTFQAEGLKHFYAYLIAIDEGGRRGNFEFDVNEHLKRIGAYKKTNGDFQDCDKETAIEILILLTKLSFVSESSSLKEEFRLFSIDGKQTNKLNKNEKYGIRATDIWYRNALEGTEKLSSQYVKLYRKLAKESSKEHADTLYLSGLLAMFWRIHGNEKGLKLQSILDWLNVDLMDGRTNPTQRIRTLESELVYMQKQGYLGSYRTFSGEPLSIKNLQETIFFSAPEYLLKENDKPKLKKNEAKATGDRPTAEDLIHFINNSGLSQKQIANRLGVSTSLISKIKTGEKKLTPNIADSLQNLIGELNV